MLGALLGWVSLRRILRAPMRSLLVVLGIALGVAALVATLTASHSIRASFVEMTERVAGRADLVITAGEVGLDPELIGAIDEIPEVAHVAGTVEVVSQLERGDGPVLILGVDFLGDRHFLPLEGEDSSSDLVVDDPLAFVNDPSAILISASLARRRGVGRGDAITLLTPDGPQPFEVWGILREDGLARAFGGQVAVMFQEALMLRFAKERIDRIDVAVGPGVDPAAVQRTLADLVGRRGRVEPPEGRARHVTSILEPIEIGLQVAGALALLVGMFIIYNAVGVAVAQRRREIGVLRALGTLRRGVVAVFCLEQGVLALIGSLIGVGMGAVLAQLALDQAAPPVSRFYAAIRPPAPEVSPELAVSAVVAGVVAALLAAYLPARLAATVDPAETLRRQAQVVVRRPLPHRALFFAGTALLIPAIALSRIARLRVGFAAMGMFLLVVLFMTPSLLLALRKRLVGPFESLLGVPGRLALDNAARRLDRSALIAGALMLSVSASVLLGTWGASMERSALFWLDRALPADLYVTSGSVVADQHNVAFRPEVMDKLRGLRGVRRAYPVRIVTLDVRDRRILMVALDGAAYFDAIESKQMAPIVLDGPDPLPLDAVTERPGILLAENSARRLGVGAGDRVTFETPTGTVDLEVVAVVVDYTSDQGAAIIDRRWYLHYWGDPMIDTIDLVLEPGADPEAVRSEVKSRLGGGEQLFVVSAADLREEIRRILVDSLAVFRSTELIALVVALLGVIGTLLAAVLDRTREIGVLRAIGTTRSQVLRAVVGEAGFLGLASAVGGVLAGIPMGYVFVDVVALTSTGWRFEYVFPEAAALRVTGLVVFAAAVAGIWPGRHAARLDVPEALSYE